jgi:hypothetical protein
MMGHTSSRSPTIQTVHSRNHTTIFDGESVQPESSIESRDPLRIETLLRAKYDIIKQELKISQDDEMSHRLANQRGLMQQELEELLARSSVKARMSVTTFTPWRYDIREHLDCLNPVSSSQFERFQNSVGITKADCGPSSFLKLLFVNCQNNEPTRSDLLRFLGSPLLDGFVDIESIDMAGQYGRVFFIDFRSGVWDSTQHTPTSFIRMNLINSLSLIFNGTIVDGVPFSAHEPNKFAEFQDWFHRVSNLTLSGLLSEVRRLTRIAFRARSSSPVVLVVAGIDRVDDDEFAQVIRGDFEMTQRPVILVCESNRTDCLLDRLRQDDKRPMTSSSITITNGETKRPKRKRKYARRIRPRL